MNEFDPGMREWNNKCPKCGSRIHFSLRSSKLGASAHAHCGNSVYATQVINLNDLKVVGRNGDLLLLQHLFGQQ